MKKHIFLSSALALLLNGATLEVYQDLTIYNYEPKSTFIGFASGLKATCSDENIELQYKPSAPCKSRLCKIYNELNTKKEALTQNIVNIKTIDSLISNKTQEDLDAKKVIENAKIIAKEKSTLATKSNLLKKEISTQEKEFKLVSSYNEPLYTKDECDGKLKLTIPYGYINFKPIYEANIEDNEVKVTQKIFVTNRSGIDIEAKKAKFYYRAMYEYVNTINFTPWIAQEFRELNYKVKRVAKAAVLNQALDAEAPVVAAPAPIGRYDDAREYTIENLNLPSSTKPTKVKILNYTSPIKCELKAYPSQNSNAVTVCSFKPKFQIDSNTWIVKEDNKIVNKNAIGRYEKSMYSLYTKVDKDIKIIRKKIVSKERQSGIFGGTRKQKDGYKLLITNKSNKKKELKIIERIPTSNTDKIEVKLLSIKPKVDYKLSKNGKVEINLELNPNEHKTIEVMFELSYDKELRVRY